MEETSSDVVLLAGQSVRAGRPTTMSCLSGVVVESRSRSFPLNERHACFLGFVAATPLLVDDAVSPSCLSNA